MSLLTAFMLLGLPGLENPGFEDPDPLEAWKTWIYKEGSDPTIRLDGEGMNSRDDPERIAVSTRTASLSGTDVSLEFGPFSLSLYELEMGG